jgi:hypothetical protein
MEHFNVVIPKWLRNLASPECHSILFFGCGGGFDFTHSLLLLPSLLRAGKRITILSNSVTNVATAYASYPTYFSDPRDPYRTPVKQLVPRGLKSGDAYVPEQALVEFIGDRYPDAPVTIYASDCHRLAVASNTELLQKLVDKHQVDTVVTIDGGTDSLMRGDEASYATIIEDFMSLAALDNLRTSAPIRCAMLLVTGFGVDRFHGATDASSMRAVAELTRMGGFLGCASIDQSSEGFVAYSDFLLYCRGQYQMAIASIVGGMVAAATVGQYGPYQEDIVPRDVPRNFERSGVPRSAIEYFQLTEDGKNSDSVNNPRVGKKDAYIWPLMGQIFAFDVEVVMQRNLIAPKFKGVEQWDDIDTVFRREKKALNSTRLQLEDFPRAAVMKR